MLIRTPELLAPPWLYRLLIVTLSPLLLGYTLWRACKDGGYRYFWQRLGWYSRDTSPCAHEINGNDPTDCDLWVHAASVGEVITVMPLLKAWLNTHKQACVTVTTATPTGAAIVQQQKLPRVQHQYLPVDFSNACRRFVSQCSARNAWIVETEIWPWLYAHCRHQQVRLTIINGRLSERTSTQSRGWLAKSYRQALQDVYVLARSEKDFDRFLSLGATHVNVEVAGNLKYGAQEATQSTASLLPRRYVLAASTHSDEELRIARAWQAHTPIDTLLVIVPRHPERGNEIKRQLAAQGISIQQRSKAQQPQQDDTVYLADTLGELQAWYEHATGAFVGASLIARGGHNMLEPACYACPTIVGPHTQNFEDIMESLESEDAIATAEDEHAVAAFLVASAREETQLIEMGQRAQRIAMQTQDTLGCYLSLLERH